VRTDMYFSISARTPADSVSEWRRLSIGTTPSYRPRHWYDDRRPLISNAISRLPEP